MFNCAKRLLSLLLVLSLLLALPMTALAAEEDEKSRALAERSTETVTPSAA